MKVTCPEGPRLLLDGVGEVDPGQVVTVDAELGRQLVEQGWKETRVERPDKEKQSQ